MTATLRHRRRRIVDNGVTGVAAGKHLRHGVTSLWRERRCGLSPPVGTIAGCRSWRRSWVLSAITSTPAFRRSTAEFVPSSVADDPNNLVGPPASARRTSSQRQPTLPYSIEFENDPKKATAAAQDVTVTTQLDPNLDWSTFELGSIQFGSTMYPCRPDCSRSRRAVDTTNVDGTPLQVDISAGLNEQTGLVTWTFLSDRPGHRTADDRPCRRLPAGR